MIKIAICDDIKIFADELKAIISSYNWTESVSIETFSTATDIINAFRNGYKSDIIFMDIQLVNKETGEKIMGTDVASIIKSHRPQTLIVYISSYDIYYADIAQSEPFKFIKKPARADEIYDVLDKAYKRIKYYNLEYLYEYNGKPQKINLNDISYIYSVHRKVFFCQKSGKETFCYKKLDDVEKEIDKMSELFARANKSYLVNLSSAAMISRSCVMINNGLQITISKKYKEAFMKKWKDTFM